MQEGNAIAQVTRGEDSDPQRVPRFVTTYYVVGTTRNEAAQVCSFGTTAEALEVKRPNHRP